MDLLAITAQLFVLNGTAQDQGAVPGLISQPAPPKAARGRERDFLFAHLTLSGLSEETTELSQELTESLGRRFFATSGSVTSALRRAVLETNEQLLRHNLESKGILREGALSCAVLHGQELYTLQVGEGLAFLGHNFGVERLPVQPPRTLTPLGRTAGIDIRFAYHRLQSGDMMLLADPRLAHLTGAALTPVLVDTEIESGLEALVGVVGSDTARLLLVEFADEIPPTLPLTFQHSKKPEVGARPSTAAPAPRPATAPVAAALAQPKHAGDLTGLRATEGRPPISSSDTGPDASDVPARLETGARRVASRSARGLSRATDRLAKVLGQLRRQDETAEMPINWALPAMLSLIIPIVIAAVITSVYLQRGNVARLAVVKQEMGEALAQAEAAGGPAEARAGYEAALALAAEADELRPDDGEVARMRATARDALDRIDGVTRMTARSFFRYEDETNLTGITLRGTEGGIAVLDQAANRVLFHATDETYLNPTAEEPSIIAYNGQPIGAEVIGPVVDLTWLAGSAAETRDGIAMLDRTGVVFSYYPNLGDIRGERLGNSGDWREPVALTSYLGRLYVLDTGAQQIWKYFADNGFTQSAEDPAIFFSAQAGLDQAVDFDLYSEDGSLVVIYNDGRIRYYDTRSGRIQWDENTLLQNGLATPLVSPVAVKLVGRGLNASVFVLDPASSRLVQLSRGGTVLTQFRILDDTGNEILSRAADFAVVDSPLSVFVVAGNEIYLAER